MIDEDRKIIEDEIERHKHAAEDAWSRYEMTGSASSGRTADKHRVLAETLQNALDYAEAHADTQAKLWRVTDAIADVRWDVTPDVYNKLNDALKGRKKNDNA